MFIPIQQLLLPLCAAPRQVGSNLLNLEVGKLVLECPKGAGLAVDEEHWEASSMNGGSTLERIVRGPCNSSASSCPGTRWRRNGCHIMRTNLVGLDLHV